MSISTCNSGLLLGTVAARLLQRNNVRAQSTLYMKDAESTLVAAEPLRRFVIRGVTHDGRSFRPSDWAERLASAMSSFRPEGGAGGIGAYIGYSPYCVPTVEDGVKCVFVDEALRGVEPMAWDFVMNFARDNALQLDEVRLARAAPSATTDSP